jgi:hypothetical protein
MRWEAAGDYVSGEMPMEEPAERLHASPHIAQATPRQSHMHRHHSFVTSSRDGHVAARRTRGHGAGLGVCNDDRLSRANRMHARPGQTMGAEDGTLGAVFREEAGSGL